MPAFFVHGVPDTAALWDDVVDRLDRPDIIRAELPGFAEPLPTGFEPTKEGYAAWLAAEVESVGEPVDLVGHDWGSLLVVRVATTRPELIRTLTFGGGPIDETYEWHEVAKLWQTADVGEQLMAGFTAERAVDALAGLGLTLEQATATASRVTDDMRSAILTLYRSAVLVGDEWGPALDAGFDFRSLSLWGADDIYSPPRFGGRMSARLGGRSVVFAGCHHWWPLARPDEVAAELQVLWG